MVAQGIGFGSLLLFLFQVFRRLRQDYPEEEVVKASVLGLVLGITTWYLVRGGNFSLVMILLVIIFVVYLFTLRAQWHFWATLEVLTTPGLETVLLFQLARLVIHSTLVEWVRGGIYLLTLLSGYYWRRYRQFSWYPSGKSGFFFLASLATLALLMALLDFWQRRLLELGVWMTLLTVSLIAIWSLSGREKEEKLIVEKRRKNG